MRKGLLSLFPVLPDVAAVQADIYAWAAAFGGVLLAIWAFHEIAPVLFGTNDDDEPDDEEADDDRDI